MKRFTAILLVFILLLGCGALAQGVDVDVIHFRTSYKLMCESTLEGCAVEWRLADAGTHEATGVMMLEGQQLPLPRVTAIADSSGSVQEIRALMDFDLSAGEEGVYNQAFVMGNIEAALVVSICLAEHEGDFEKAFAEVETLVDEISSKFSAINAEIPELMASIASGGTATREAVVDGRLYSFNFSYEPGPDMGSMTLEIVITGA